MLAATPQIVNRKRTQQWREYFVGVNARSCDKIAASENDCASQDKAKCVV
jgi:hypothetical protein